MIKKFISSIYFGVYSSNFKLLGNCYKNEIHSLEKASGIKFPLNFLVYFLKFDNFLDDLTILSGNKNQFFYSNNESFEKADSKKTKKKFQKDEILKNNLEELKIVSNSIFHENNRIKKDFNYLNYSDNLLLGIKNCNQKTIKEFMFSIWFYRKPEKTILLSVFFSNSFLIIFFYVGILLVRILTFHLNN